MAKYSGVVGMDDPQLQSSRARVLRATDDLELAPHLADQGAKGDNVRDEKVDVVAVGADHAARFHLLGCFESGEKLIEPGSHRQCFIAEGLHAFPEPALRANQQFFFHRLDALAPILGLSKRTKGCDQRQRLFSGTQLTTAPAGAHCKRNNKVTARM